jgi:hypothetical protein
MQLGWTGIMSFFGTSQNSIFFVLDRQQYYWRRSGKRLLDQHVQPAIKFGRRSIMVWGCMSWEGVGNFNLIERIMDKYVYPAQK